MESFLPTHPGSGKRGRNGRLPFSGQEGTVAAHQVDFHSVCVCVCARARQFQTDAGGIDATDVPVDWSNKKKRRHVPINKRIDDDDDDVLVPYFNAFSWLVCVEFFPVENMMKIYIMRMTTTTTVNKLLLRRIERGGHCVG